jgi:hypothetical protein
MASVLPPPQASITRAWRARLGHASALAAGRHHAAPREVLLASRRRGPGGYAVFSVEPQGIPGVPVRAPDVIAQFFGAAFMPDAVNLIDADVVAVLPAPEHLPMVVIVPIAGFAIGHALEGQGVSPHDLALAGAVWRCASVQMLSQLQQQHQRLLDMPRSAPVVSPAPAPQAARPLPAQRGDMRRRILALLREYPEGLRPTQVRQLLGVSKDLVPPTAALVATEPQQGA